MALCRKTKGRRGRGLIQGPPLAAGAGCGHQPPQGHSHPSASEQDLYPLHQACFRRLVITTPQTELSHPAPDLRGRCWRVVSPTSDVQCPSPRPFLGEPTKGSVVVINSRAPCVGLLGLLRPGLLTSCPGHKHLTSLCLGAFIQKMGIEVVPTRQRCCEDYMRAGKYPAQSVLLTKNDAVVISGEGKHGPGVSKV